MNTLKEYIEKNKDKAVSSLILGKTLPSEYLFQGVTSNEMYSLVNAYAKDNKISGFSIPNVRMYTMRLKKIKAVKPARKINPTLHYFTFGQVEEFVKIISESVRVKIPFFKYALAKFFILGHLGYLTHPETDPNYRPELLDGIIHEIATKSKADRKLKTLQHWGLRALAEVEKWEKELKNDPENEEIREKLQASMKRHATITKKIDAYSALLTEQSVKYVV